MSSTAVFASKVMTRIWAWKKIKRSSIREKKHLSLCICMCNLLILVTVMSTNIRIFEYLNKIALEYYSYSYSFHFSSTNIFRYWFVDFWTTEYIRIFVRKLLKIGIYLNIYSEQYFNICLSIFDEKSTSRYSLCTKKSI